MPRPIARETIRVLERHGFVLARSSGSHHIQKNAVGKRVTVPLHASKTLHPKVLRSMLRDMDMTMKDLKEKLRG